MIAGLLIAILLNGLINPNQESRVFLPIHTKDRHSLSQLELTSIGAFGVKRKARKDIPSHYHTGVDIKRPDGNYDNDPIYPIAKGIVISKRTDGPYAQLIIEHELDNKKFWSLYEHIAGVCVDINSDVQPEAPMARFMNKGELDRYGWQFDHFHLEIIKIKPTSLKPTFTNPDRFYNSYSLICYSVDELEKYFIDPIIFFQTYWN